jgi:hypothetical protein
MATTPEELDDVSAGRQGGVLHSARAWVGSALDLIAAETRLAVLSVFGMLYLTILGAAAVVVAWCLLSLIGISLLEEQGVPWRWSAAIVVVLHLFVVFICWEFASRLSRNLTLPALRRAVRPPGVTAPDARQ